MLAPEFMFEIGGTTSINAVKPGMNKAFGMVHLMEELGVEREDILYFGDMTQPGGNDFPVLEWGLRRLQYVIMKILGMRYAGSLAFYKNYVMRVMV